ncbi:unnamed protein product [Knipowitschia caucasica]
METAMGSGVMPGFQVMSDLLTMREKAVLRSLIQPNCELMKSTVAQVLQSQEQPEEALAWSRPMCGVLCVIKDQSLNTHFLRLFCLKNAELLWEHEVYVPFQYNASCSYFHSFPADGHHTGFNFADETEAEEFHFSVENIRKKQDTISFENTSKRNKLSPEIADIREKLLQTERRISAPAVAPKATAAIHSGERMSSLLQAGEPDSLLKRLMSRSRLSEEELMTRSVSDIVDHIIAESGGVQAIQMELHRERGANFKTLPRYSGASLPRTPSTEQDPPVKIKKRAILTVPAAGGKDDIIIALTKILKKRQQLQTEKNEVIHGNTE